MLRRLFVTLIAATALFTLVSSQTAVSNTAFRVGEQISFNLYFNWKFVWYKVGTASMSVADSKYKGKKALKCNIITRSNGKLDKYFFMRDTLLSYVSPNLLPYYYRKGAHEGKRYTVDEVWYETSGSQCKVKMQRLNNDKTITRSEEQSVCDAYDMLTLFLRSRNYNFSQWKAGQTMKVDMVSGKGRGKGLITFKGREKVKADDGKKYETLRLEFAEYSKSKKKYQRLATFYITDDKRHLPVRLDFNLRFGEAKAYMTGAKGTI